LNFVWVHSAIVSDDQNESADRARPDPAELYSENLRARSQQLDHFNANASESYQKLIRTLGLSGDAQDDVMVTSANRLRYTKCPITGAALKDVVEKYVCALSTAVVARR